MSARPFIKSNLRLAVNLSQAEERITPSTEDSLELEVSNRTRERGVETSGGIITNFVKGDEVVFDLEDDVASVRELIIIQEEIINAFDKIMREEISESNIVVKADYVRVIPLGL